MGQKAVSDHSKEVLKRPSLEEYSESNNQNKEHMSLEFNMDEPKLSRNKISIEETNTKNGIIVQHIPRPVRVRNLKINILSKFFGTGKQYKNSNFQLIFGMKIDRNIENIRIFLVNSNNYGVFHDREAVKGILESACFKVKKKLVINEFYNYYTYPKLSEFSTFLTLPNDVYDRQDQYQDDIFCNPYSRFNACIYNLELCLMSINQTVPENEKNIILPSFYFNLVGKSLNGKEDFEYFFNIDKTKKEIDEEQNKCSNNNYERRDECDREYIKTYHNFFEFLNKRFENICFELELEVEDCSEEKTYMKKLNFIDYFFQKFQTIFSKYKNVVISIQFKNNNFYKNSNQWKVFDSDNIYLKKFREIMQPLEVINLTLAMHYSYLEKNGPYAKLYNSYDSVYCDKEMINRVYTLYFVIRNSHAFKKIRSKKPIIMGIFISLFGYSKIKSKRLNYDVDIVNNPKLVQIQMGKSKIDWINT